MSAELPDINKWLAGNNYFDDLAIFSLGSLHPGGTEATNYLANNFSWEKKKVLDIGVGNGTTMRFLHSLGADCTGVEKSAFMIHAAIKNGIPRTRLHHVPVEDFTTTEKFDIVIIEGVIGFLKDPLSTLAAIFKLLNPGGCLFINDWVPFTKIRGMEDPDYFLLYGRSAPASFIRKLQIKKKDYKLKILDTVSKSISTKYDEIFRRVELFFETQLTEDNKKLVEQKIMKMKMTLGENVPTKYYLLSIRRT
jgi:2-polyprenyl-3-methyl-5-hydroxy-6-metoxy-1,4-benzoquinol methylase